MVQRKRWTLFLLLAAIIYGVGVGVPLFAGNSSSIETQFGEVAFGYPIRYVFCAFAAIYLMPFLLGAWHFLKIVEQLVADGVRYGGKIDLVHNVLVFRQKHPEQAASWWILVGCGIWFLLGLVALQYLASPSP